MSKLRYSRTFKSVLASVIVGCLLFASVIVLFIVSKIQYDALISNMNSAKATIVDIDLDVHVRGPNEQEIYITYNVDGVAYSNKLKTDTTISFAAGIGAHYSVGDQIDIFYDPQNPTRIASSRSVWVGTFYSLFSLIGLVLLLFALFYLVKNSRKFLITQEEYDKEKKSRNKNRQAGKK